MDIGYLRIVSDFDNIKTGFPQGNLTVSFSVMQMKGPMVLD